MFDMFPAVGAPLEVPGGMQSASTVFPERGLGAPRRMFLRVAAHPVGGPEPEILLQADTGVPVRISRHPDAVSIRNAPGPTATRVATAFYRAEPDGVYRVDVVVSLPGRLWQLRLGNTGSAALRFTWVVADTEPETRQPWIDVTERVELVAASGDVVTGGLFVTNSGTAELTLDDPVGTRPAPEVEITAVPPPLPPGGSGELRLAFTGPSAPTRRTVEYTVASNDTGAGQESGHNRRAHLALRGFRLLPGTVVVLDKDAGGVPGVHQVHPDTGVRRRLDTGPLDGPVAVAVERDGHVLVLDVSDAGASGVLRFDAGTGSASVLPGGTAAVSGAFGPVVVDGVLFELGSTPSGARVLFRVDPVTGQRTVIGSDPPFSNPRALVADPGGTLLVADIFQTAGGGFTISIGRVFRVDPDTGARTTVAESGQLRPEALAVGARGIYVADQGASRGVVHIDPASSTITTLSADPASLHGPLDVAVVPPGDP